MRVATAAAPARAPPLPARAAAGAGAGAAAHPPPAGGVQSACALDRRLLLTAAAGAALALGERAAPPPPAAALPLAPLAPAAARVGGANFKRTGLSAEEVAAVLGRNLSDGQYFVTGDLSPEIFDDDCRFIDPTNDVRGLARYLSALRLLFDASASAVRLREIRATSATTVEATWVLGGYLKFPWHPRIEPVEGATVYTLDARTGLVVEQRQTWSISPAAALIESFTPTAGAAPDVRARVLGGG